MTVLALLLLAAGVTSGPIMHRLGVRGWPSVAVPVAFVVAFLFACVSGGDR